MGAEHSRKASIPDDLDQPQIRSELIVSWTKQADAFTNHNQHAGLSSISSHALEYAGRLLNGYFGLKEISDKDGNVIFDNFNGSNLIILEVFGGNGIATQTLSDHFVRGAEWFCTDVIEYPNWKNLDSRVAFEQLNAVDAVAKYGKTADILLMVSPPPNNHQSDSTHDGVYGDYYACHDFIEVNRTTTTPKFIIFCGELGASDASQGMYRYLFEHPNLVSVARAGIQVTEDVVGGRCEKELFIFAITY